MSVNGSPVGEAADIKPCDSTIQRTTTLDTVVAISKVAKSFGLFKWAMTALVVAFGGILMLGAETWAKEQIAAKAAPLVKAHADAGPHAGAATTDDLVELHVTLKQTNVKLDELIGGLVVMQANAVEAAKDRAAVLCKAIRKTAIKGDQCVLAKTKGRDKKTVPLVNLKALRTEVYGE